MFSKLINSIKYQFKPVLFFFGERPRESAFMSTVLFISSFAEALGMAMLFPLVSTIIDSEHSESRIHKMFIQIFEFFNIEPSIGNILIVFACLIYIKAICLFLSMIKVGKISSGVARDTRERISKAFLRVDWNFFTGQRTGDITAAIGFEAERLSAIFIIGCRFVASTLQVIAYLSISIFANPYITLAAIIVAVLFSFAVKRFMYIAKEAGELQTVAQKSLMNNISESFNGFKAVKTMGIEDKVGKAFTKDIRNLFIVNIEKIKSKEGLKNIQEPLYVTVVAVGLYLISQSNYLSSPSDLLILPMLFYRTASKMSDMQKNVQSLIELTPAYYSTFKIIKGLEKNQEKLQNTGDTPMLSNSIKFENVSFSYGAKDILKDTSITIPKGKLISIIGRSGSGKTTTIDLVAGLLGPSNGKILIDDKQLEEYSIKSWRQLIGYVPQESFLFYDTVKNNITFHQDQYSDEDVWEALEKAGAKEFAKALDGKLEYIVGEKGYHISGGQRQRISIARALLKKPKLLILDEATASLDPRTEKDIIETLVQLKDEITILAISHQNTIHEYSDELYFLEDHKFVKKDTID
jgi:ATP-binding cassette subfamily C protein